MFLQEEPRTLLQAEPPAPEMETASPSVGRFSSSDFFGSARFVSGTILAGRYRIVGLIGQGGMGEVYRAEDLRLGQTVALKFLPEALAADGTMLARFHREVRIARQVSHPNVCRMFDIGEMEGLPFLSMEYIDGEDLSSLLKRIGRLPGDKGVEIARQLCAGLAAAHDAGVLHRDLKPSNVMIDGRGRVRITDFGLAGVAGSWSDEEGRSGTPAYMAPEQLAGEAVTVKSDLYALGLVLYEMFTGKRVFEADTLPALIQLRRSETTPTTPSLLVKDLDPLVERVTLRCLEKDPRHRPATALQVAAALPGGDPLAAALAAGETPSPEMVAAAPAKGALPAPVAVACLASFLIGFALIVLLSEKVDLHRRVPLDHSPEVLADRASTIIKKLGYADAPADRAYGFSRNGNYLRYVMEHDDSPARWEKLADGRPWGLTFWYRQSPRPLQPSNYWNVSFNDPPLAESGMVNLLLDTRGRLIDFYCFPPVIDDSTGPSAPVDWSVLFALAELDKADFKPVESKWVPPVAYDQRAAWEGVFPEQPQIPLRIEAATYRGKPVYFEMFGPWTRPARLGPPPENSRDKTNQDLVLLIIVGSLTGGVVLARRNLRLGRGDRKGAFRLAIYVFVMSVLGWVLEANHVPTSSPIINYIVPLAWAAPVVWSLYTAGFLWLYYMALEPDLRQRWPHRIISWSRLLASGWRDPLVGRDVLIGGLFGVAGTLIGYLGSMAPKWMGWQTAAPKAINYNTLTGVGGLFGQLCDAQVQSLIAGLGTMILVLLLYMSVRREWIAVAAVWLLLTSMFILRGGPFPFPQWLSTGLELALFMIVLMRFGLLAVIASQIFDGLVNYPLTSDFSVWYAGSATFALLVAVALAVYGFHTCLAGQPLFRDRFLQD